MSAARSGRRRRAWALTVSAAVALLSVAAPHTAAARAAYAVEPLRVMALGDSFTHAPAGDSPWRYWVWREARVQGVPMDFVGAFTNPHQASGPWYETLSWSFDTHHQSVSGSRYDSHLPDVPALVAEHRPDVIVVALGYNDVSAGETAEQIAGEARQLADLVWSVDPSVRLVFSEIPGGVTYPAGVPRASEPIALQANELVATGFAGDDRVRIAAVRSAASLPWNPLVHTHDGVHPNAVGATLLGHRIGQAMWQLGVFPKPVAIYRQRLWNPNPVPVVKVTGTRVRIDWSGIGDRILMTEIRVQVDLLDQHLTRQSSWYRPGMATEYVLPRGRYRISLIPKRRWMIGFHGTPVTVTVS